MNSFGTTVMTTLRRMSKFRCDCCPRQYFLRRDSKMSCIADIRIVKACYITVDALFRCHLS